jgi:CRP/FNR family cyclic AMP-dependent transcriptional regulator
LEFTDMGSLLDRFSGADGQRHLRNALAKQPLMQGLPEAVEKILAVAELQSFAEGEVLMSQNATDNHIVFILSGRVSIQINGRLINFRGAGQHVGEMALIDASARRSATVTAIEDSIVGKVNEPSFCHHSGSSP